MKTEHTKSAVRNPKLTAFRLLSAVALLGLVTSCATQPAQQAAAPAPDAPAKEPEPRRDIVIQAPRVADIAALEAPNAAAWRRAPAVKVPMIQQHFVEPFQQTDGTREVAVRAMHDGKTLAVLLQWRDADANVAVRTKQHSDGCAVMFPRAKGALPSVMMGEKGKPVTIYHWKASRQFAREGEQRLWADVYPMSGRSGPIRPDSAIYNSPARSQVGGWAADNPLSKPEYETFIHEIEAEGPGTVTHRSSDAARGRGEHSRGVWRVTFLVPLPAELPSGIAFSVWQGGAGDVGGRKSLSPWVFLEAQK
jgi:hypothetical protein